MSFYARHVLPRLLDRACALPAIDARRARIVPHARGRVVEIGIGSGLNLSHYDPARVESVRGVDPDARMWARSADRRAAVPFPVERVGLDGQSLPIGTGDADTVVVTYSLCTIPDPVAALREMARILKPGGAVLFAEHGRAPNASVARWQGRVDPVWRRLAGGCHTGRDIPALFGKAGLRIDALEEGYVPGPKVLAYNYVGSATPL